MPYAVSCPRCQTVVTIESLGAFDCPQCDGSVARDSSSTPPPLLPQPLLPSAPPPAAVAVPPPTEIDWQPVDEGPKRRFEPEPEPQADYEELHRRRARKLRNEAARRKLLTKLAFVFALAVATAIAVRAAYVHVSHVAEHNATIRHK